MRLSEVRFWLVLGLVIDNSERHSWIFYGWLLTLMRPRRTLTLLVLVGLFGVLGFL